MYKCSVCKSDTKYDEFSDYENEICIDCEEEYKEDYAQRKGEWE